MRRFLHICLACAALLAAAAGIFSCTFRDIDHDAPTLNVYVFLEQGAATKSYVGDIAAVSAAEKAVNSLQIWVFKHSNAELIGYISPSSNSLSSGSEEKYSTMIKQSYADEAKSGGLEVDVYVLANASSIGLSLNANTSRSALDAALISGDWFGTTTLTDASAIEAKGLPMSCVATKTMTGTDLQFEIPKVTLTRAVSKVRFVFCRASDDITDFTVTGISFDANTIPENEYVFNDSATQEYKTGSSYVSSVTSFPVSGLTVPVCSNYLSYIYSSQAAQDYENMINQAVNASPAVLAQVGQFYLRESGKKISGKIDYTYTVEGSLRTKSATFTMDAEGDFARNHSWIVYAYFLGERLVVQPKLIPWIAGNDRYTHTTQGSTDLVYEKPWLRYDIDKKASTWDDTWVSVAYGFINSKPSRSPLFQLKSSSSYDMALLLNSDEFEFRVPVMVTEGGNSYMTYPSRGQRINIAASSTETITEFYVVPVSAAATTDRAVKVMLTEFHAGDGLPPVAVPFNHNLPGDEDHTSILIYNVGTSIYDAAKTNEGNVYDKTTNEIQNQQYWWEEKS